MMQSEEEFQRHEERILDEISKAGPPPSGYCGVKIKLARDFLPLFYRKIHEYEHQGDDLVDIFSAIGALSMMLQAEIIRTNFKVTPALLKEGLEISAKTEIATILAFYEHMERERSA